MKFTYVLIITMLIMQGCSRKQGRYSVISTKPIDLNKSYIRGDIKVEGQDISKTYILFPTKIRPMVDDAVQDALDKSCAQYLTDVDISLYQLIFPFIYGEQTYKVKGYPWYEKDYDKSSCKNSK